MKSIIFKDWEVLAVNDGRKTSKRILKGQKRSCKFEVGDIIYVKETWDRVPVPADKYYYKADGDLRPSGWQDKWNPSIHMPRDAARLFLRVTNMRVERLQEITSADCEKEGVDLTDLENLGVGIINHETYTQEFQTLWDSTIKGADLPLYGWDANPWCWVISFERITKEEALAIELE